MKNIHNISCPNCGHEFDVEEVLAGKVEAAYKKEMDQFKKQLHDQYSGKQKQLALEVAEFEAKKRKENELFQDRLKKALLDQELQVKERIKEEYAIQLQSQNKELAEKTQKIRELKEKEVLLAKMQRQLEEQEKDIELKYERKMMEQMRLREEQILKRVSESMELRLKEKDKQLEDQKKLIEEMKRKADQGSMQLQGEVMELAIEDLLSRAFPHDIIEEVPKGIRGADSLQTVVNNLRQSCGKIIFESKRTKTFSDSWIQKLKLDQMEVSADIAVLVTQAMPRDMEAFGEYQGIWICSFAELTNVVYVLRQILIRSYAVKSAQENKGEKIEILYNYLTSIDFKNQMTAIIEGFSTMKDELEREKRAMKNIWKRREKQIELVVDNTINMYGSIKGIAGNAIPTIEQLELTEGEEDDPELY